MTLRAPRPHTSLSTLTEYILRKTSSPTEVVHAHHTGTRTEILEVAQVGSHDHARPGWHGRRTHPADDCANGRPSRPNLVFYLDGQRTGAAPRDGWHARLWRVQLQGPRTVRQRAGTVAPGQQSHGDRPLLEPLRRSLVRRWQGRSQDGMAAVRCRTRGGLVECIQPAGWRQDPDGQRS